MNELVRLRGLGKVYDVGGGVTALRDVDLTVHEGEYVAIMGHSGSGKSTMLNILGCLDRPSMGEYWLGDEEVSTLTDNRLSEIRNQRIGFVFQSFNLIQTLSVVENIEVPLFYQGVPRHLRADRGHELAQAVGLGDRAYHRPSELSGGQQQRVAVGRALSNDPLILLADEPTGNLDSHTTVEILDLFAELHSRGRTIIMVTHEDDVAAQAERVVHLSDGRVDRDIRQRSSRDRRKGSAPCSA